MSLLPSIPNQSQRSVMESLGFACEEDARAEVVRWLGHGIAIELAADCVLSLGEAAFAIVQQARRKGLADVQQNLRAALGLHPSSLILHPCSNAADLTGGQPQNAVSTPANAQSAPERDCSPAIHKARKSEKGKVGGSEKGKVKSEKGRRAR